MRVLLLGLVGCPGPPASTACDDMCEQLMAGCGFAAFPDVASCQQGCRYELSQGASIPALQACLLEAECDTPTVLACARAYGASP